MKIVFGIKEDDARNPGVIADCTGDNAGDSVGPSADGFETYGVTGVALITFILLAVPSAATQVLLLVWLFVMRIAMVLTSAIAYFINESFARALRQRRPDELRDAAHHSLVWVTSLLSVVVTFVISYLLIPGWATARCGGSTIAIIERGTLAGAIIPEMIKIFLDRVRTRASRHRLARGQGVAQHPVGCRQLQRFWMGIVIVALMGIAFLISGQELSQVIPLGGGTAAGSSRSAWSRSGFWAWARSPSPSTRTARSPTTRSRSLVSLIEKVQNIEAEVQQKYGFLPQFDLGKHFLEENDGAGNTFKATANPCSSAPPSSGDHADLLDHHDPDQRPDGPPRKPVDPACALSARPDHRRVGDLLVHRRIHPGGLDGRPTAPSSSSSRTSSWKASKRRPSRIRSGSSRSARSTRSGACSTSS